MKCVAESFQFSAVVMGLKALDRSTTRGGSRLKARGEEGPDCFDCVLETMLVKSLRILKTFPQNTFRCLKIQQHAKLPLTARR